MSTEATLDIDRRTVAQQQRQVNKSATRQTPGVRTHRETPGGTENTTTERAGISITFEIERVNSLIPQS